MAEIKTTALAEDDDETFGDFEFASSFPHSNPAVHSRQINGPNPTNFFPTTTNAAGVDADDDDGEWGDFMSPPSNHAIPSHDFSTQFEFQQYNQGMKSSKAIPLSIFGEPEVEEDEGSGAGVALNNDGDKLFKKGVNSGVSVQFNDIIANLYNKSEESKMQNGLNSKENGSTLGLNGLNFDSNVANIVDSEGLNSDSLMLSQDEKIKIENVANPHLYELDFGVNVQDFSGSGGLISSAEGLSQSEHTKIGNGSDTNFDMLDLNVNTMNFSSNETGNGSTLGSGGLDFSSNGSILGLDDLNSGINFTNQSEQIRNENVSSLNIKQTELLANLAEEEDEEEDDNGWEFQDAGDKHVDQKFAEGWGSGLIDFGMETAGRNQEIQVGMKGRKNSGGAEFATVLGSRAQDHTDLFSRSKPNDIHAGFDFFSRTAVQDNFIPEVSSSSMQNDTGNKFNSFPVDGNDDSDENTWEFKEASLGTLKHEEETKAVDLSQPEVGISTSECEFQVNGTKSEDRNGALPLSLFSDEELEYNDSLNNQDVFVYKSTSHQGNMVNKLPSTSLTDLISSLYSQAEKTPSINISQNTNLEGSSSTKTVLDSTLTNGDDDFDDSSWEFKVSFAETMAEDRNSVLSLGDAFQPSTTKLKAESYVEFLRKLKDELCLVALCHVGSLKKAKSVATRTEEYAIEEDLDEDVKEAYEVLHQESTVSVEICTENHPSSICLNEYLEVLAQSRFQVLESEYDLSRRLSLVEKDLRSAVELLKDVSSILKVLFLGSTEEQSNYISAWSRIISVCVEEIKHGAFLWKRSMQYNVDGEILAKLQGQRFILALGEIYRVVQVLGASAKVYKPWILSNCVDAASFFNLVDDCSTLWSDSGLEEALGNMSNSTGCGYEGTIQELLKSVKHLRDLDAVAIQNPLLAQQDPMCQLSLLTPAMVPGVKMVVWNGENYFLPLANLWANTIHSDPPPLSHTIHVG